MDKQTFWEKLNSHDDKLSDHEVRICNMENYAEGQETKIDLIDKKIDKLIYAIGAGMLAIILMLVPILFSLL